MGRCPYDREGECGLSWPELVERMTAMEGRLERLIELKDRDQRDLAQMHASNSAVLAKLDAALRGNGGAGLLQRVHDLERVMRGAGWVVKVGGAVVVTQIALVLLDRFARAP